MPATRADGGLRLPLPGGAIASTVVLYVVLVGHTLLTLFPFVWVLVNSFRDNDGILTSIRLLPERFDTGNYERLLASSNIPLSLFNSVTITAASLALLLAVGVPLAFALARFRFRAAEWIYMFFALAVLVPAVSVLPMTFKLFVDLGLLGTKYGIAFVYATEQLPITVFLLVAFMRAIPHELDEAAVIDGCGPLDLLWRVILPLSRNGIVTVLILAFVAIWNDYLMALILLPDQENRTLSVVLANAKDEYRVDYGMMSAAIVFAITPMLLAYVVLKERIVAGMATGAVKG
ncbi:MAG: carbohydrate ABC transporter permease [Alphaproteobacteria bacterium]|nr:carbohydrate ABC transporter permease [Alphaproteobacteria bacterium]